MPLCLPGRGQEAGVKVSARSSRDPAHLTDLLLCMSRCLCRENGVRNRALHSSHWNGLSSEWVCRRETESEGHRACTSLQEMKLGVQERKRREGNTANTCFRPPQTTHPNMLCAQDKQMSFHILAPVRCFICVHTWSRKWCP